MHWSLPIFAYRKSPLFTYRKNETYINLLISRKFNSYYSLKIDNSSRYRSRGADLVALIELVNFNSYVKVIDLTEIPNLPSLTDSLINLVNFNYTLLAAAIITID